MKTAPRFRTFQRSEYCCYYHKTHVFALQECGTAAGGTSLRFEIVPAVSNGWDNLHLREPSGKMGPKDVMRMNSYRIFIVEDDEVIARVMCDHLSGWGYTVRCAADFNRVLSEAAAFDPHLVLLDIMLPFFNGYHWCAGLRKISRVPIIFISSASDNMNLVMAMNMGGDDFLAKPFELPVLTAKVQALLRRTYDFGAPAHLLSCGGAILNLSTATLTAGAVGVELTRNELKILQLLMENKGKTVSREALMTRLWESDAFVDENTLSVNVPRLRKKLDGVGLSDLIRTKKGVGYEVE